MDATSIRLKQLIRLERIKTHYLKQAKGKQVRRLCDLEAALIGGLMHLNAATTKHSKQHFVGLLNTLELQVESNRDLVREVGLLVEKGFAGFVGSSSPPTPNTYGKTGIKKETIKKPSLVHAKV